MAPQSEQSPVRLMARSTRPPSSCGASIRKGPSSRAPLCSPIWCPRRWWDMPLFTWACAVLCFRSPSSGFREKRHFGRLRARRSGRSFGHVGGLGGRAKRARRGGPRASVLRFEPLDGGSCRRVVCGHRRRRVSCARTRRAFARPGSLFSRGEGHLDAANLARPLGEGASVIVPRRDAATHRALAATSWNHARCIELAPRTGNHEGLGGWALACGAALVASVRPPR